MDFKPFTTLEFPEGHAKFGEKINLATKKPFILSYNTKTLAVEDFVEFPGNTNLPAFKSVIINSLENFLAAYEAHLKELVQWHEQAHNKQIPGTAFFDGNGARGAMQRAITRFEMFLQEFSKWTGTETSLLLPYAELVYVESKKKDEKPYCDITKSSPLVNGMLFHFSYTKQ